MIWSNVCRLGSFSPLLHGPPVLSCLGRLAIISSPWHEHHSQDQKGSHGSACLQWRVWCQAHTGRSYRICLISASLRGYYSTLGEARKGVFRLFTWSPVSLGQTRPLPVCWWPSSSKNPVPHHILGTSTTLCPACLCRYPDWFQIDGNVRQTMPQTLRNPCLTSVLKAIQVVGMVLFFLSLSDCTSNHNDVVCDTNNYRQPYWGQWSVPGKPNCLLKVRRVIFPCYICRRVSSSLSANWPAYSAQGPESFLRIQLCGDYSALRPLGSTSSKVGILKCSRTRTSFNGWRSMQIIKDPADFFRVTITWLTQAVSFSPVTRTPPSASLLTY